MTTYGVPFLSYGSGPYYQYAHITEPSPTYSVAILYLVCLFEAFMGVDISTHRKTVNIREKCKHSRKVETFEKSGKHSRKVETFEKSGKHSRKAVKIREKWKHSRKAVKIREKWKLVILGSFVFGKHVSIIIHTNHRRNVSVNSFEKSQTTYKYSYHIRYFAIPALLKILHKHVFNMSV